MKLSHLIPESHVAVIEGKPTKEELLSQLLDFLLQNSTLRQEDVSREDMLEALIVRERAQSTAIGDGVAFPHARILGLKGVYHLIAVCREGVDFDAFDEQPVRLLLVSLVNRETPTELLRGRAAFIRFLNEAGGLDELVKGAAHEIWQCLDDCGTMASHEILAKDLMYSPVHTLDEATSLRDAARVFHLAHADSLPIVDDQGNFKGDMSCIELFRVGLPDFFQQLHTVSFVKHMNPFEKYFQVDQSMAVSQLLKDEPAGIPPDATVMELIFEMAIRDRSTLYVVDDGGRLLGVIDRFNIIDKILVSNVEKTSQ